MYSAWFLLLLGKTASCVSITFVYLFNFCIYFKLLNSSDEVWKLFVSLHTIKLLQKKRKQGWIVDTRLPRSRLDGQELYLNSPQSGRTKPLTEATKKNKAIYTAALVPDGWAGAENLVTL